MRPARKAASGHPAGRAGTAHGQGRRARRQLPLTISREELLVDGSDRAFRQLVHDLFGFLARHEEIRAGHARFIGLRGIEYTVLITIAHLSSQGDVNVKTVADHLHLSGAFITTITRRLVANELVHKQVDPLDRRRVTLSVTDQGYQRLEELSPTQRQVNDAEFGCLSKKEFEFLLDVIRRLIECGDQAVALQRYLSSKPRQGSRPANSGSGKEGSGAS